MKGQRYESKAKDLYLRTIRKLTQRHFYHHNIYALQQVMHGFERLKTFQARSKIYVYSGFITLLQYSLSAVVQEENWSYEKEQGCDLSS